MIVTVQLQVDVTDPDEVASRPDGLPPGEEPADTSHPTAVESGLLRSLDPRTFADVVTRRGGTRVVGGALNVHRADDHRGEDAAGPPWGAGWLKTTGRPMREEDIPPGVR